MPLHDISESPANAPMKQVSICLFGIIIIVAGLPACLTQQTPEHELERPRAVRVVAPTREALTRTLDYVGTVRHRQEVQVSARTFATVADVRVAEGDSVRQGSALLRMSAPELDAQIHRLRAELERTRTDQDYLCRTYEKDKVLANAGALPPVQADASKTRCITSNEALKAASAALSEAHERRRKLQEAAPAAGIVLQRWVEPGEYVSPGRPLFLLGSGELEARIQVAESDIQRGLAAGTAVIVRTKMQEARTRVRSIAPTASQTGRTVEVRLELPKTFAAALRSGMSLDVRFVLEEENQNDATLPQEAILESGEHAFVFAVAGERLQKIPVELGVRAQGRVQVSLPLETQVVVGNLSNLHEGDLVYAVSTQAQARQ